MITGLIQKDMPFANIYGSNMGAFKYIKKY